MTTKKRPKAAENGGEATIETVLKNIEASMLALSKKKDAESVASLGRIGRLHAQIRAENRKAEKEERRAGAETTHEQVLAYARALRPEERTSLVQDLQALDSKRSGLA